MYDEKFAGLKIARDCSNVDDVRIIMKFKMIDKWHDRDDVLLYSLPIQEAISLAKFLGSEGQLYNRFSRFGCYNSLGQSIEFQRHKEHVPFLYGSIYLVPSKNAEYLLDLAPTFHPIMTELNKVYDRNRIPLTASMAQEISDAIMQACDRAEITPYKRFFRQ